MIAPANTVDAPRLLVTSEEAAELLSVSPRTLARLTVPHGSLPALRIGTGRRPIVRYRVADLEQWIAEGLESASA